MPIAILMPVYNDPVSLERTLGKVRDRASHLGGVTVFLVDDGSQPSVDPARLPAPTRLFRIVLARHAINLGQGAALETARQLALREAGFSAYVTMDADGQHRVEDAMALARAIDDGADVAFGNRFLGDSNVPSFRAVLLWAAGLFEWFITGLPLGDAHNGLRAFSHRALVQIPIRQNRMAHATEIKQRVSRADSLTIVELPTSVRYTRETLARGQRSLGAATILYDLLAQYLFGEIE
jgi:glycosyltransferase involved in cell wall biosynthesis